MTSPSHNPPPDAEPDTETSERETSSSAAQPTDPTNQVWNVPNQVTMARLVLSIVVFVLIPLHAFMAAFVVFVVAASTDWIDGYWARKYNQVTKLGRILDPFVDKIIICGTFILLAAERNSGIYGWMAVVVVGRELLVTALRSFIEQSGGDFSASFAGKLKMVFQCIAVGASMVSLSYGDVAPPDWIQWTLVISVWVAVISTVQSGIDYVLAAMHLLRE